MPYSVKVEYADARKMRSRNKPWYRVAHWPIWIWVFFLAPGPLTFDLFAKGGSVGNLIWLGAVLVLTGLAAFYGQAPRRRARPYILRFTEDRPNPLYRRICYTFAWNALLNFALLNLTGLAVAVATGTWYMKQIYARGYTPLLIAILALGSPRRPPARPPLHPGRRLGAPLLLRNRLGRHRRADRPAASSGRRCRAPTPPTSSSLPSIARYSSGWVSPPPSVTCRGRAPFFPAN